MKKLLLLVTTLFITYSANAQDDRYGAGSMPVNSDGKVVFSAIVPMEGQTAKQLYSKAKMAVAELFKSSNDVIQLDDPENGVLIIKGANNTSTTYVQSNTSFTLKFFFKDDRYKIDITDIKTNVISGGQKHTYIAEDMTDENCLKNGECKKTGWGMQRRNIIDTKEMILDSVKKAMSTSVETNNNW